MPRNRILYGSITVGVLLLGLISRRYFGELPFIRAYVGDVLWALMVFFGIALFRPHWPTGRVARVALLVAVGIEISQLYHAPWVDGLRATRLGGLILGFSFVWSDLLCYGVGVGLGFLVDRGLSVTGERKQRER